MKTRRFSRIPPGPHFCSSDFFWDSLCSPKAQRQSSFVAARFSSGRSSQRNGGTRFACFIPSLSPPFAQLPCPGTSFARAAILISSASSSSNIILSATSLRNFNTFNRSGTTFRLFSLLSCRGAPRSSGRPSKDRVAPMLVACFHHPLYSFSRGCCFASHSFQLQNRNCQDTCFLLCRLSRCSSAIQSQLVPQKRRSASPS